jgi:transcription antitermination factor NusG
MTDTLLKPWFAVQTRPRHEKVVHTQLQTKGYETFMPTYRARRRWADRVKVVVLPLFEGYVFCRLDLARSARVITTQGVIGIVSMAGAPAVIEDAEIAALQQIVASSLEMEPWPFLRVGQRVRIETGPLAGVEGILESMDRQSRIIVSITLLQRSVAVELHRDVVGPIATNAVSLIAHDQ